ncbi:MAG: thermonuclease family protein [Actinomycetota bacterium]|nr:thermonuclease family protein [Actinomycetota bacterium]
MVRSRAVVVVTLAAASVAGTSALGWWLGTAARTATPDARVVEVIDGDTVVVALPDGTRDTVRLLGVDTPETKHPTRPVGCFGPEASAFTRSRLLGRTVRLESDTERRDTYGRRLAYVWLDGRRFNDVLLRAGYARFLVIPPNDAHGRDLLLAELDARAAGRGLWSACR